MVDSTQVWATCPLGAVDFNFPPKLSGPLTVGKFIIPSKLVKQFIFKVNNFLNAMLQDWFEKTKLPSFEDIK